jgi:uncharacterized membrane protein
MRFASAFILVPALLAASPVLGALAVCNKAKRPASVALGRFNGTAWMSQGWWTVAPRKCAELIAGPLDARYYYLYADDGGAGAWDGGTTFCTAHSGRFSIAGRQACAARGYDLRGFFRIDTGQAPNWTQSLSD